MRADVQIQGLDRLRRATAGFDRTLNTELRKGIRDAAAIVRGKAIQNARAFSAGGRFPQSIRYHVSSFPNISAVIGSLAPTALSIEVGRKSGEVVKVGLIMGWLQRRGLFRTTQVVATQKIRRISSATLGRQGRLPGISAAERNEAWRIVKLIRQRGTRPHAFLIPALLDKKTEIERVLNVAVRRALVRIARAA